VFCNTCGVANDDKANFCVNCGGRLVAATVVVNPAQVMGSAAPPQPAQIPPAQMPPATLPQSPAAWSATSDQPQTSGKAIASLILGIANGLFMFLFFPLAILAIVFGHISRAEIRKSAGHLKGSGMALAGLILGYASLSVFPIMIIAAIAIPNLLSARKSANESSAVGVLRTVNTAAVSYQAGHPEAGYPQTLDAMSADGLIDPSIAAGERHGYRFTYTALDENGDGVIEAYVVNADPVTPGTTGRRHFFTDESGVIRVESDQMASKESPPIQ
jgi:type IV pilus assembly protein PilA